MGNLLNVKEAAQALGCSTHFLYRWAQAREIPYYRIGKALRFDADELRAWARSKPNSEAAASFEASSVAAETRRGQG